MPPRRVSIRLIIYRDVANLALGDCCHNLFSGSVAALRHVFFDCYFQPRTFPELLEIRLVYFAALKLDAEWYF